ncbi:hypothetical protein ACFQXB_00950 [Plastorhodobacter daqingensis]|uniref:Glycosyl transferase n=1 Tax=Plastorhodobacter daqingensis TaxID=1387281 RepID=A0ABW2UGQ6_9RHOB
MPDQRPRAALQVVLLFWGTKYGADHVNALAESLRDHASAPLHILCLSDRPRQGLTVAQHPIPEAFARPEYLGGGCQAKLSVFSPGLLEPDIPALLVDLDTMVTGDVLRLLPLLERPGIYMLPATWGTIWPLLRILSWILPLRWRGNSSLVLFRPGDWTHVPDQFLKDWAHDPRPEYAVADDKYLSRIAGRALRRIPPDLAVKFTNEFASRIPALAGLLGRMTRTRARRQNLVAITFSGGQAKPEQLQALPEGAVIPLGRGRRLVWSAAATSGMMAPIKLHWSRIGQNRQTT